MYYSNVDYCILPALNEISSEQAAPTTDTADSADWLMDYLHTYSNAVIRFYASDMILKTTVDAAYLVLPRARSRASAHYHLGWNNSDRVNGAIDVQCRTIQNVVSSAAEAETSGIYAGGRHACPILAMLEELRHKQPDTGSPLETDNKTAHGILNSKMRQKLSMSFDMRFWWLKDRISQRQFDLLWSPGKQNKADYFTKHHPPWHHRIMRPHYIQQITQNEQINCTISKIRQILNTTQNLTV